MSLKRIFLIVLDSFGIGEMPDARKFGDEGCNTLATIIKSKKYNTANLKKMGLFNIDGVVCLELEKNPIASYSRLAEASNGKDTIIGHWEIAGIISNEPLPTYPNGFPESIFDEFKKKTGRNIICNKPYSGTEVIKDYGKLHIETGDLIIYTSADSVFQIAAHEDVVPILELYRYCEIAREILTDKHAVGRVIARPFTGKFPDFKRTSNRHDYSLLPPSKTILDYLTESNLDTICIGKIYDIFAGQGITKKYYTQNNIDGMQKLFDMQKQEFNGLCFTNLVDFDMLYGHRNDIDGYANAMSEFDSFLGKFINNMKNEDLLIITADHGCDPGFKGTEHTREYVPMIIYGNGIKNGVNLGTRNSFSDISKTILDIFNIKANLCGESFLQQVLK